MQKRILQLAAKRHRFIIRNSTGVNLNLTPFTRCYSATPPKDDTPIITEATTKPATLVVEQAQPIITETYATKDTSFQKTDYVKFGLVGLVGGCFGGLVGLGGNIILIPLLGHVLDVIREKRNRLGEVFPKFTQKQLNATCLVCVVASGLVGSSTMYLVGNPFDLVASGTIGLFACLTASSGARIAQHISDFKLKLLLVIFMLFVAPLSPFLSEYMKREKNTTDTKVSEHKILENGKIDPKEIGVYAALGSVVGLMSGILGVGGGIIMIPTLSAIWASQPDKNHKLLIGTSLAALTVPAMVACYSHYRLGNVVTRMAPMLVVGAMCGGMLGGFLSGRVLDEEYLKYIFAVSIAVLGTHQLSKLIKARTTATIAGKK